MSHISTIEVSVDSLDSLKKALEEMGYTLKEKPGMVSSQYGWNRTWDQQVVDKTGKALNIGFNEKDGKYILSGDYWGTGINQTEFAGRINQLHAKYKAIDAFAEKKFKLTSQQVLPDGNIKVVMTRWV